MNTEYTPTEEELTAYALGEVDDTQSKAIEAAIANQPETAELLEAIRETVAMSKGLFTTTNDESLSDAQRAEVTSAAENVVPMKKTSRFTLRNGLAAAAMLAIMSGVVVLNNNDLRMEVGMQAKYELTDDRKEVIRKLEIIQTGVREPNIDYSKYKTSNDQTLEAILQNELGVGIERFLITNINNPAGAARFDSKDYSEQDIVDAYNQKSPNRVISSSPSSSNIMAEGALAMPIGKLGEAEEEWFAEEVVASGSSANDMSLAPPAPVAKRVAPKSVNGNSKSGRNVDLFYGGFDDSNNGGYSSSTGSGGNRGEYPNSALSGNRGYGNAPTEQSAPAKPQVVSKPMPKRSDVKSKNDFQPLYITYGDISKKESKPAIRDTQRHYVADTDGDGINDAVKIPEEKHQRVAGAPPVNAWYFQPNSPRPEAITPGSEAYDRIVENKFKRVAQAPLSTFSIDVDTASYSNMRRFLTQGQMPPVNSVRIEELINYFNYDYPQPTGNDPFSSTIEVASAPWNPHHKLVRIGLKGKDIVSEERPPTNLVFLLDVSGSMSSHNKLPLVKQSIRMLTQQLTDRDRVAIVVYAGNSGLVLPSTRGNNQEAIISALDRLNAGGSTNGGAGIELAYRVAAKNFIKGGVNRVILATDGDFNVGNTSRGGLVQQIESSAKTGVFLSVLGFGMGNLKDATMENLADKGNGNYAYIDTFHEAKKVLVDQMNGTLFTIAKDVKIQVEFNPNRVASYRLIGYENRALANRDFNDDTKDAGEIGAGHTVTALYEIIPKGVSASMPQQGVDELRYKKKPMPQEEVSVNRGDDSVVSQELLTVKLRYKQPEGHTSKLLTFHVSDVNADYNEASKDFKFASAVAAYGMKLRHSPFAQHMTYDTVLQLAEGGVGHDLNGYRSEFIGLVRQAKALSPQPVQRQDYRK